MNRSSDKLETPRRLGYPPFADTGCVGSNKRSHVRLHAKKGVEDVLFRIFIRTRIDSIIGPKVGDIAAACCLGRFAPSRREESSLLCCVVCSAGPSILRTTTFHLPKNSSALEIHLDDEDFFISVTTELSSLCYPW